MEKIEIVGKCQGEIHRIEIRIEGGTVKVSCLDHNFDLDEIQEAMEGRSATRNFCLGVYTAWTGVHDVSLAQVQACTSRARSHGLTSKIACEVFGKEIAYLMYQGVRSPMFARKLVACMVWPTGVPFDPAAAERFVNSAPSAARLDFAVAATAGGIGFDRSDIDWLGQEGVDLKAAVESFYEPPMWRLMKGANRREELNSWWRAARVLLPSGNGRLIINLVATLPSPLVDLDLVPIGGLELLTTVRFTHGLMLAHRMITDFNIHDAPTLVAIIDSKWTLQALSGLSRSEVQQRAQELLRQWRSRRLDESEKLWGTSLGMRGSS